MPQNHHSNEIKKIIQDFSPSFLLQQSSTELAKCRKQVEAALQTNNAYPVIHIYTKPQKVT